MSLGWEVNAVPELGGRPQGIINKQLLEDADILIGIFASSGESVGSFRVSDLIQ
jgi:hypothetical protein